MEKHYGLSRLKPDVETILQSIDAFGKQHQSIVCIEEPSELIKAITKLLRKPSGETTNLTEEMADVYICLIMLQKMYNIEDEDIQQWLDYKTNRQKGRNADRFKLINED